MLQAVLTMLILGALLGLFLGFSSVALHVEEDPRIETVTALLPGYNCGACGKPGCSGLAAALVNKEETKFLCKPCAEDKMMEIIDYLKNTPGPDGEGVVVAKR